MIGPSSPFRRIPFHLDPHQGLFLGGIRWTAEMMELQYKRLLSALDQVTTVSKLGDEGLEALADAWALVDSTYRFRELIQQLPGLKSSPDRELFVRKTAAFEKLRNSIQHLRNEISALAQNGQAVWGTLSWLVLQDTEAKAIWSCALQAGGRLDGRSTIPFPVGGLVQARIDKITLTHNRTEADLSDAYRRAATLLHGLERSLESVPEFQGRTGPHQGGMQLIRLDLRPDWGGENDTS